MITRDLVKAAYPVKPLAEVAYFLDSRRKPVKESERNPGPYPYYGANGKIGTIDQYIFDEPLVLLAEDGGFFDDPDRGIAYRIEGRTWVNNHAHVIKPKDSIDLGYLCRVLENYDVRPFLNGSTRSKLTKAQASNIPIPLPALDEQKRIAAILDKADKLRRLRQRAIDRLNQLGQSTFAHHQKQLDAAPVKLSDLCHRITDGTHQSPTWAEKGIPFLFVSNIRNQEINFETDKYVSEDTYQSLTRKTSIDAGDVLYTCVGSYGHSAVVPDDQKFIFQRHIAHLKPDPAAIDSTYLMFLLESPEVRRQADKGATGIAQKTVTLTVLKSILVKVPDIQVQRRVARYLSRVRGQRRKLLCDIQKQNLLFSSIQQRAFRGEL